MSAFEKDILFGCLWALISLNINPNFAVLFSIFAIISFALAFWEVIRAIKKAIKDQKDFKYIPVKH